MRYAKDDPRSEMIFAMLAERRIKLTPQDDDFVDGLYNEVFGKKRPLSKIAARTSELEVNRRNGILKELKEARNQRQTSGSIIDPLRQMYRRAHDGQPAKSIGELYEFNPLQDEKLEKEYRQVVVAVWTAWGQAEKQFASRNYGYDDATRASEAARLQSTGYAGFKKRFEDFVAFLDDKRADDRALFQLLKWSRDVLLPHTEIKGPQTQTRDCVDPASRSRERSTSTSCSRSISTRFSRSISCANRKGSPPPSRRSFSTRSSRPRTIPTS